MKRSSFILVLILLLAILLRMYGINWDQGRHMHPDERMLIMVVDRIHLFNQLNPDFYNYGSLPIYILRGVSQTIDWLFRINITNYDGLLLTGRYLSLFCDVLVIFFIYKLALLLWERKDVAVWSALIYALAFFPIQNSHFFIVDTFLNLFAIVLIYLLVKYYKKPLLHYIPLLAIVFAASLTTKISAIIFLPIIGLVFLMRHESLKLPQQICEVILKFVLFTLVVLPFSFIFMPYAFIEYLRFFNDISQQMKMNSDPYIFPYTLQYVDTTPYLYYLKNIFMWGLGPLISLLALGGTVILLIKANSQSFRHHWQQFAKGKLAVIVVSLFYLVYFIVIGRSAVKFMRYMLVIYPFLTILAGLAVTSILNSHRLSKTGKKIFGLVLIALIFLWTTAFITIYSSKNTRIQATEWIFKNIPAGSTLATEHWDDRVPIDNFVEYQYVELPLYERPDNERKWSLVNQRLDEADYIILASNRLYVPLQRLDNCNIYTSCFPVTSQYYKKLFNNELNFTKVAEFTSYPRLQLGPITLTLPDDSADESFTVYDHPKIIIFKKN